LCAAEPVGRVKLGSLLPQIGAEAGGLETECVRRPDLRAGELRVILLDTDVASEPLKTGTGDPRVIAWLDRQSIETLYLSTLTVAEVLYGIAVLAVSRRRDELHRRVTEEVFPQFASRILVFDVAAPRAAARAAGRTIPDADSFIVALAISRGLALARRNAKHSAAIGLQIINPWD
jgi:predicted nucleic acid-binding protein